MQRASEQGNEDLFFSVRCKNAPFPAGLRAGESVLREVPPARAVVPETRRRRACAGARGEPALPRRGLSAVFSLRALRLDETSDPGEKW